MPPTPELTAHSRTFAQLLRRRLDIIADRELYLEDPASHLALLQAVSEEITKTHAAARHQLPARLNHFLDNASFQKALEFVEADAS